jgi:ribose/xylose/arabinose/galactoside ABC-type transport system permease subunit
LRVHLHNHGILLILGLIVVAASLSVPGFFTADNIANIVRQSSVLVLLALGQTFVIVAGMLDLSVGSLVSLVVVLSASSSAGGSEALPIALGVGLASGLVTGSLVNFLRINPLVLTLGMMTIINGIVFVYTEQSIGAPATWLVSLANGNVAGIPAVLPLVIIVAAVCHGLLQHTRFGLHLQATGGSDENARHAGIRTNRIVVVSFIANGLLAAVAGLILLGRIGTGYPNAGSGLELDAIVAVVLGGTSLAGGRGSMITSALAAVVLSLVSNILNLLEISAFVQMTAKGLIVLSVVLLNQPPKRAFA